jgi:pSer/pThr/pTyr-binding forkhead associated (FHA) protein
MRLGALSGPQAGIVIGIGDHLTIGRAADCRLILADPKVSRRHAELWSRGSDVHVKDSGSLNGTWLNDRRIEGRHRLRAGDRLRIGGSEFIVQGEGDASDVLQSFTVGEVGSVPATTDGAARRPAEAVAG